MSSGPVEVTIYIVGATQAVKHCHRWWNHVPRVGDIIEVSPKCNRDMELAIVTRVQWGEWHSNPSQQAVALFVEWKK